MRLPVALFKRRYRRISSFSCVYFCLCYLFVLLSKCRARWSETRGINETEELAKIIINLAIEFKFFPRFFVAGGIRPTCYRFYELSTIVADSWITKINRIKQKKTKKFADKRRAITYSCALCSPSRYVNSSRFRWFATDNMKSYCIF